MTKQIRRAYYEKLIDNRALHHPDLSSSLEVSLLGCATVCLLHAVCTTFDTCDKGNGITCQGSRREGTCMEKEEAFFKPRCRLFQRKYSVIVGIILLVEIVAVILAAVYYDQTKKEMAAYLNLTIIDKYYGTPFTSEPLSLAWDFLHITFSCCGLDNYTDFASATNWNKTSAAGSMVIPPSCCKVQDASTFPTFTLTDTNCPYNPSTTNSNYQTTCYASLMSYVQTYSIAIIAVTSSVAVLQLIVIIAACCLCRAIGGDSDTRA
ncbi:tetraspanin-11-like isoform X2 [Lineus longissimus]|uniref:tetraspanin-11-like isoform X2 n=1 Tax=Lineus longissimus TaxID=88925 RepID=UPI00315C4C7A